MWWKPHFRIEIVFLLSLGFSSLKLFCKSNGTEFKFYNFLPLLKQFFVSALFKYRSIQGIFFSQQSPFDFVHLNSDLNLNTYKLLSISLHADYLQRALPRHWATYGVPCRLNTLMLLSLHTSTKQSENEIVCQVGRYFVWK